MTDTDAPRILERAIARLDHEDASRARQALERLTNRAAQADAVYEVLAGTTYGEDYPDRDTAGDVADLYQSHLAALEAWEKDEERLRERAEHPYRRLSEDCRERYRTSLREASRYWQHRKPERARSALLRASQIAGAVATLTGTDAPGTAWALRHAWAEECRRALADLQDEHTRSCECEGL